MKKFKKFLKAFFFYSFIFLVIKKIPILLKILTIFILCFYMQRYIRTNIAYIHRPDLDKQMSCIKYGYLFRDESINKKDFIGVNKDTLCSPFYFYLEKNNLPIKTIEEIIIGDKLLTCDSLTYNEIKQQYVLNILFNNQDGCLGFEVTKKN